MSYSAVVTFNEENIECRRSSGLVERVNWRDLRAVMIKTTVDGPFATDLFWVLVGGESGCVVPTGAVGEKELLQRLQKLPGFDNLALIEAMSCVEERSFICWERKETA